MGTEGFANDHFLEREQWDSQVKENSARIAFAWGSCNSTGWGEYEIDDPIMFGVTFVRQPNVAHGWAMKDDEQLVEGRYPRANGGVVRWVQDDQDFYIGAHVLVTVATVDPLLAAQDPSPQGTFKKDPGYRLTHTFTFTGLAIKDISP